MGGVSVCSVLHMDHQLLRRTIATARLSCSRIFAWADDCLLYNGPQPNRRYSPVRSAALLVRVWPWGLNPTPLVPLGQHEDFTFSYRIAHRPRSWGNFRGWAGAG